MYSILKTGAKIEIRPYAESTKNCVASTFWMKDGYIWCNNPVFGTFRRDEMTEEALTEHISNMMREGFQMVVHC